MFPPPPPMPYQMGKMGSTPETTPLPDEQMDLDTYYALEASRTSEESGDDADWGASLSSGSSSISCIADLIPRPGRKSGTGKPPAKKAKTTSKTSKKIFWRPQEVLANFLPYTTAGCLVRSPLAPSFYTFYSLILESMFRYWNFLNLWTCFFANSMHRNATKNANVTQGRRHLEKGCENPSVTSSRVPRRYV